jgi:hypothetical protein
MIGKKYGYFVQDQETKQESDFNTACPKMAIKTLG